MNKMTIMGIWFLSLLINSGCNRDLVEYDSNDLKISIEKGEEWLHNFPLFLGINIKNPPQIAIWTEDMEGNYLSTVYVTHKIATQSWQASGGNRRKEALPHWCYQRGIQYEDGLYSRAEALLSTGMSLVLRHFYSFVVRRLLSPSVLFVSLIGCHSGLVLAGALGALASAFGALGLAALALLGQGVSLALGGGQHHRHVAPVLTGHRLDGGELTDLLGEALQEANAGLGARLLSTAEHDHDLDLVAGGQEALHVALLDAEVVIVDLESEADFLQLRVRLVAASIARLLGGFVLVLAVIHELCDGRLGVRRNLNLNPPCGRSSGTCIKRSS